MSKIITITGPSGSGKTTILNYIKKLNSNKYYILHKYTTRPRRNDPTNGDGDDIVAAQSRIFIEENCDCRYEQYGELYGISYAEIDEFLKQGKIPIIVVNNGEQLEKLHKDYSDKATVESYYVHRGKPNRERFTEICHNRGIFDQNVISKRFDVAQDIYRIYVDKISLFSGVILNTGTLENLHDILCQLFGGFREKFHLVLRRLFENFSQEIKNIAQDSFVVITEVLRDGIGRLFIDPNTMPKENKIFIISGGPGSGKDIIAQSAEELECEIVRKHTDRKRNKDDKDEIICSNDGADYDLDNCDIVYTNYGNKYGIKTDVIRQNLQNNNQILVCSNIDAINKIKSIFGKNVVCMYVHSDMTEEEYEANENRKNSNPEYISSRVKKFQEAGKTFIRHLKLFKYNLLFADNSTDESLRKEGKEELLKQVKGVIEKETNSGNGNTKVAASESPAPPTADLALLHGESTKGRRQPSGGKLVFPPAKNIRTR